MAMPAIGTGLRGGGGAGGRRLARHAGREGLAGQLHPQLRRRRLHHIRGEQHQQHDKDDADRLHPCIESRSRTEFQCCKRPVRAVRLDHDCHPAERPPSPHPTCHRRHALRRLRDEHRTGVARSCGGRRGGSQFCRPQRQRHRRCVARPAGSGRGSRLPGRRNHRRQGRGCRPGRRRAQPVPGIAETLPLRVAGGAAGARFRIPRHAGRRHAAPGDDLGLLAAGRPDPGRDGLLRPPVFQRCRACPARRAHHHGQPDRARHERGLGLFALRDAGARLVPGRHCRTLLGRHSGRDRAGDAGTGTGDARPRPHLGCGQAPDGSQPGQRLRVARRGRNRGRAGRDPARGHPARPPRGNDRG